MRVQHLQWMYEVRRQYGAWELTLWCRACGDAIDEPYDSKAEAVAAGALGLVLFSEEHDCPAIRFWS